MRLLVWSFILLLSSWNVLAASETFLEERAHKAVSTAKSATKSKTASQTGTPKPYLASRTTIATRTTSTATTSASHKKKHTGLTKGAKIGVGVGVPLGVLGIVGAIIAYVIGRRRGSKRRVDDPKAGASGRIRDPSDETMLPGVAEAPNTEVQRLSELQADSTKPQSLRGYGFFRSAFGSERRKKEVRNAPGSPPPQEMEA